MQIKLRALKQAARLPKQATSKSFGYDLVTTAASTVMPGRTEILPTSLRLAQDLPIEPQANVGLAMLILPRSSLPLKYGLIVANSPGVIDADYTGEIGIIVYNITDKIQHIEAGTRVAQALFVEAVFPEMVWADSPEARPERGGFGSTGK